MDLRRLEYFCAIIDKGQISKAAKSLHISQSPLSQRLKELEEELGVTLIHRDGRTWQVTPEGYMLYKRAQYILMFVKSIGDDIRCVSGTLHGLVRIGICPPCRDIAASVIAAVVQEHPKVRFQSWVMDNQSLERHLQEGHLDFAVVLLPVTGRTYKLRRLRPLKVYAVFGNGLEPPPGESIDASSLVKFPLILQERREGGGMNEKVLEAFQKENLQPNFLLTTQDPNFLKDLLKRGVPAVAIMNELEVESFTSTILPRRRVDFIKSPVPAVICLQDAFLSFTVNHIIDDICTLCT